MSGKGITVLGLQGDVRQQESCERWVSQVSVTGVLRSALTAGACPHCVATAWLQVTAQLGGLDILVNCAAGAAGVNASRESDLLCSPGL
jgi:NAD(P)-dependent dehydrogenase (short-subunit alcohol dehydrogenase family)